MIETIKWDSKFFGKKIGRLTRVPAESVLRKYIRKAHENGYEYLTCRLVLEKISEVQRLENSGFYIADIGVVWERKTDGIPEEAFAATQATLDDSPMIEGMSAGLFRDSRFYNDPFFTYAEAENLYRQWIRNSLHDRASRTFFIESCGFIIVKKQKNRGEIVLIGVVPEKQRKGAGRRLVYHALAWLKRKRVDTVTVRTQANNMRAMNFYAGLGFRMEHMDMTMGLVLSPVRSVKAVVVGKKGPHGR